MTQPHETNDARRLELVAAAQRQWTDALTDLGGRNTLLYYKDRRAGTLDLAAADPDALERFEKTGHTRLTRLFQADADQRADAIRRMQTIYRKARELQEERGIRAGYLATGLARWDELFLEPAAPVLLRALTIAPTRARYDDFDLTLDDDVEVNPVLLHKLASVFGAVIEKPGPERIAAQLARAAANGEIPGFTIEKRKVIGTFTYAKLPMVRDLEAAGDLLADSDLVAAIAGDAQAQQAVAADPGQLATARRRPRERLLHPRRRLIPAQRHRRRARGAQPGDPRPAGHRQEPDDREPDRGDGGPRPQGAVRRREAGRDRRRAVPAGRRQPRRPGARHPRGHPRPAADRRRPRCHPGPRRARDRAGHDGAAPPAHRPAAAADGRHAHALHRVHEPWRLSAYQVQSALLGVPPAARVSARLADPEDRSPPRSPTASATSCASSPGSAASRSTPAARPGSAPRCAPARRPTRRSSSAGTLSARTLPRLAARLAAACRETGLPPACCQLSRTYAADSPLQAPPRGGPARPRVPRAARAAQEAKGEWAALAGGARRSPPGRRAAAAVGVPGAGPGVAGSSRQLAALAALAPLAGLEDDPEQAAAALAADRGDPVAAAPAARAGAAVRAPSASPAAR